MTSLISAIVLDRVHHVPDETHVDWVQKVRIHIPMVKRVKAGGACLFDSDQLVYVSVQFVVVEQIVRRIIDADLMFLIFHRLGRFSSIVVELHEVVSLLWIQIDVLI